MMFQGDSYKPRYHLNSAQKDVRHSRLCNGSTRPAYAQFCVSAKRLGIDFKGHFMETHTNRFLSDFRKTFYYYPS